jgi:hypothetical protein
MYPDLGFSENTTTETIIAGVAPVKMYVSNNSYTIIFMHHSFTKPPKEALTHWDIPMIKDLDFQLIFYSYI